MERLFRAYLLGRTEDEKKCHLLEWDKICSLFSLGGLGIRKLTIFSKAHLGNGCGGTIKKGMLFVGLLLMPNMRVFKEVDALMK